MKNTFYFILKALFVIMTLCSCRKNGSIRKIRLISKFITSQPGEQTIAIHMLSKISGSKSNQAMKLGQLIDYNKRNTFLQKLCKKMRQGD